MTSLQKELIGLTFPNQRGIERIKRLTYKQLKYEIDSARRAKALFAEDEGDVLSGRVNIQDA